MIGTIANTAAIVLGSSIGAVAKRGLGEKYQDVLFLAMGLAAVGIGANSIVKGMGESVYPVLFIASLAIGGVIGTALDINGRFDRFVDQAFQIGIEPLAGALHGNHDLLLRCALHHRPHQQRPLR